MAGVRGGGVDVPRILSKGLPWWCVQRVLVFYQPVVPSENFLSSSEVRVPHMGCCITKEQGEPAPVGRLAGTKAKAEAEVEAEAKARCWLRRRLWLI